LRLTSTANGVVGLWHSANWHWSLGHQRLSIMDPTDAGNQPFVEPDIAVAANGEIYNFRALYDTLPEKVETVSDSDSEVLMHLYRAFGSSFVPKLDGMFAFVLVDQEKGTFLAARDHVGIKPLYMGKSEGKLMFASELKCLVDVCDEIEEIPNGTYYTPEEGFVKFYNPSFLEAGCVPRPSTRSLCPVCTAHHTQLHTTQLTFPPERVRRSTDLRSHISVRREGRGGDDANTTQRRP